MKYSTFVPSYIEQLDFESNMRLEHHPIPTTLHNTWMYLSWPVTVIGTLIWSWFDAINSIVTVVLVLLQIGTGLLFTRLWRKAYNEWSESVSQQDINEFWHIYVTRWLRFYGFGIVS